jgi:hypothetical protein
MFLKEEVNSQKSPVSIGLGQLRLYQFWTKPPVEPSKVEKHP